MLSQFYYNGWGVFKDLGKTVDYLKDGALSGSAESMNFLGLLYHSGEGVPKDTLQSYVWLILAASKKAEYSKSRDLVGGELTGEQRLEGQRIAREIYARLKPGAAIKPESSQGL